VYLIEVNTCPALQLHGRILEDLLPRVIEETVQKAIDPLFPALAGTTTAVPALDGFELLEVDPLERPYLKGQISFTRSTSIQGKHASTCISIVSVGKSAWQVHD
jgi:hypothetical protein